MKRTEECNFEKLAFFWSRKQNKQLFSIFILLMTWPVLHLLTSFTFYIFILLANSLKNFSLPLFKLDNYGAKTLFIFGMFVFLSALFAPNLERGQSVASTIFILFQYVYWITLTCFIISNAHFFSFYLISKMTFLGLFFLTLNFFLFNNLFSLPAIQLFINRNSYVFTMISTFPISTFFVYKKYGKVALTAYIIIAIYLMLLTNGRSAAILIFLESILVWSVFFSKSYSVIKILFILSLPFVFLSISVLNINQPEALRTQLGNRFERISPRFSQLIKGEGIAGDLSIDQSWLIRELMIEKAKEINKKYPLLGIGPFNFTNYDAELPNSSSSKYFRLYISSRGLEYYNERSSHNTYIMILAEHGLIGLFFYGLLALPLIWRFLRHFFIKSLSMRDLPLISFFTISIYFYAISATGTLTYFIIGLSYASYYNRLNLKL